MEKTQHTALTVCFQRRMGEFKPIEVNLGKTTSLKLKENSFADILPCDEPSNHQFRRSEGCKNVSYSSGYIKSRSTSLFVWQCFQSLEHLLINNEVATYISDDTNTKFPLYTKINHSI